MSFLKNLFGGHSKPNSNIRGRAISPTAALVVKTVSDFSGSLLSNLMNLPRPPKPHSLRLLFNRCCPISLPSRGQAR